MRPADYRQQNTSPEKNAICRTAAIQVGRRNSEFLVNRKSLLAPEAHIDSAIKNILPPLLRQRVLMMSIHPPTARHPGERLMYDKLGRAFYWPNMAASFDNIPHNCANWAQTISKNRHRRLVPLFPASDHLELVAMDIVGLFPKNSTR